MVMPATNSLAPVTNAFGRTIPQDSGSAKTRKLRQAATAAQVQKKKYDAAQKEADLKEQKERGPQSSLLKRKRTRGRGRKS